MKRFFERLRKLELRRPPSDLPKVIVCKVGEPPWQAARRVFGDDADRILAPKPPHPSGMPYPPNVFIRPIRAKYREDDQ